MSKGNDWDNAYTLENGRTQFKVFIGEFNGKAYLNIRQFYENDAGDYVPSPKGVNIPLDKGEEFLDAAYSWFEDNKPKKAKPKAVAEPAPAKVKRRA